MVIQSTDDLSRLSEELQIKDEETIKTKLLRLDFSSIVGVRLSKYSS